MGAGAQKSGGAAALPAPPPPRSLQDDNMCKVMPNNVSMKSVKKQTSVCSSSPDPLVIIAKAAEK